MKTQAEIVHYTVNAVNQIFGEYVEFQLPVLKKHLKLGQTKYF